MKMKKVFPLVLSIALLLSACDSAPSSGSASDSSTPATEQSATTEQQPATEMADATTETANATTETADATTEQQSTTETANATTETTDATTETADTATETADATTETESSTIAENPYGLEGLTMTPDAPLVYDVRKVAQIDDNAHSALGSFTMKAQYDLGNGKMVIVGASTKEDGSYCQTLYSIDLGTRELLAQKEMSDKFSMSYFYAHDGLLWYWADPEIPTVTAMNSQLEEVKTVNMPWTGSNKFMDDGSCWYIENEELKHNLMDGSEPETVLVDNLPLSYTYISDTFTDGEHIYCKLIGDNAQGISWEMLAKLDDKMSLFGQGVEDSSVSWNVANGMLFSNGSKRINAQNWMLVSADGGTYSYLAPDQESLNVMWNNNGRVLFSAEDMDENGNRILLLWLYDSVNGLLEGMTRLPLGENEGNIRKSVMIYPDGSLLLTVDELDAEFTGSSACNMYRWYPDREHTNGMNALFVTVGDFKSLPELGEKQNAEYWDPETYVAGPLSEELTDLKEHANELGEKLGANILLGDECHVLLNCYALTPSNDYDLIHDALETLEIESTKYPDGFFHQLSENYSEMDIYLSYEIQGLEGYALDYAGGLTSTVGDKLCVAVNVGNDVATTFHHEIAHCIDLHINADLTYTKLFDSEWNKMNPDNFEYLYSYVNGVPEELLSYTYLVGPNEKSTDAYFIDDYALNYSTEDRARLMEHLMVGDASPVELDKCLHMQEKINYYAGCIRDRFDTTGWGELSWEKYLNN